MFNPALTIATIKNFERAIGDKKVQIPKETIDNYCKHLEITEEEAIQMYLEDERIP